MKKLKHAFLIIASNNIDTLKRNLNILDDLNNDIYIHLDIKSSRFDELKLYCKKYKKSKIRFIKRTDVRWGDYSLVQCELNLLKESTTKKYDYYHLLSDSDLLIKNMDYLNIFFEENKLTEFVEIKETPTSMAFKSRYLCYNIFSKYQKCNSKILEIILKIFRKSFNYIQLLSKKKSNSNKIKYGSQWFSITHNAALYVLECEKTIKKSYLHGSCVDEIFLQTILYNSNFKDSISDKGNLREINFKDGNNSPDVYSIDDKEKLMNTDKIFARKFDNNIDSKIIDCFDQKKIKKLISIVVPVYNAEKYIEQCIISILNQSYGDFELILINDGSTDNSLEIIKKYKKKDSRIIVIDKKNSGVSSTRNLGIEIANGDYIYFVDSDDTMVNNTLETISHYNQDIIGFGYQEKYMNTIKQKCFNEYFDDLSSYKNKVHTTQILGGFLFNKVFKLDIIKDNKIKFNEKISFCEDLLFVNEYLKKSTSCIYIPKCLYEYKIRKYSLSHNNPKNITYLLDAYKLFINEFKNDTEMKRRYIYGYLIKYYQIESNIDKKYSTFAEQIKNEEILTKDFKINDKIRFIIIKKFPFLMIIKKTIKNLINKPFD